jgi:hypothetical protein
MLAVVTEQLFSTLILRLENLLRLGLRVLVASIMVYVESNSLTILFSMIMVKLVPPDSDSNISL